MGLSFYMCFHIATSGFLFALQQPDGKGKARSKIGRQIVFTNMAEKVCGIKCQY